MKHSYLMESDEELFRLELKTDEEPVNKQALWAGIKPGMRVADIGCGPGKTTFFLNRLIQPGGSIVGIDSSQERIIHARETYAGDSIEFLCKDFTEPFENIGSFDFIWVRFVLEYFYHEQFDIVKNCKQILKPGGILCLIDLDSNCLRISPLSERMEKSMAGMIDLLQQKLNFDPYVGINLYSFLYDLGFKDISVKVDVHNLIYGDIEKKVMFNWMKKVEIASEKSGYHFDEYPDGKEGFIKEFKSFFCDQRRFSYTPLIMCKGSK